MWWANVDYDDALCHTEWVVLPQRCCCIPVNACLCVLVWHLAGEHGAPFAEGRLLGARYSLYCGMMAQPTIASQQQHCFNNGIALKCIWSPAKVTVLAIF
jgi:hypothetical protein